MTRLLLAVGAFALAIACSGSSTDFFAQDAQGGQAGAPQGGSASGGKAEAGSAGMVSSAGAGQGGLPGAGSGGQAGEPNVSAGSGGEAGEATGAAGSGDDGGAGGAPDVEPPPPDPCVDTPVGDFNYDCDATCRKEEDSFLCSCLNNHTSYWTPNDGTQKKAVVIISNDRNEDDCDFCVESKSYTVRISYRDCAMVRVLEGTGAYVTTETTFCDASTLTKTCIVGDAIEDNSKADVTVTPGRGPTWVEITSVATGGAECPLQCPDEWPWP